MSLPLALLLALPAAAAPGAFRLEVADVTVSMEKPAAPRTLCSVRGRTPEEERFIGRLWELYRPVFGYKDWSSFGPDASYRRVTLTLRGKTLTLKSWHPLAEKDPQAVATSAGITALEGRTRQEVLAADDPAYLRRRAAFDDIVAECVRAKR